MDVFVFRKWLSSDIIEFPSRSSRLVEFTSTRVNDKDPLAGDSKSQASGNSPQQKLEQGPTLSAHSGLRIKAVIHHAGAVAIIVISGMRSTHVAIVPSHGRTSAMPLYISHFSDVPPYLNLDL